jgi:chromosome segregation ATPase
MDELLALVGTPAGGGVTLTAVGAVIVAALRSRKARRVISEVLSDTTVADELRSGLDHLAAVVDQQGQSIVWLTDELSRTRVELASTRGELDLARKAAVENTHLRARVAELESLTDELRAQVAHLETELARRSRRRKPDTTTGGES